MDRKEEITIILDDLLYKAKTVAENTRCKGKLNERVKGCNELIELSKNIERYLNELKTLTD